MGIRENFGELYTSILIVYAYKCFVLARESMLVESILEDKQAELFLNAVEYVEQPLQEKKDIEMVIRHIRNALLQTNYSCDQDGFVFCDDIEQNCKLKISAANLRELIGTANKYREACYQ